MNEDRPHPGRDALVGLLLLALALAAYHAVWQAGFIWDDDGHVTRPDLRTLHGLGLGFHTPSPETVTMKTYLLAACLLSLAAGCGNDQGDTTTDAGTGPAPLDRDSGAAAPTEDSSPGTPYDSSPPDSGSALAEAAAPDTGTGGGGTTLTTADSGVAGEGGTDGGVAAEAGAGPWSFNYAGSVSGLAFNPIDGIGYFNTTVSSAEADAGVQTEFVAVFSYGSMPARKAEASMRLFAQQVLPATQRFALAEPPLLVS